MPSSAAWLSDMSTPVDSSTTLDGSCSTGGELLPARLLACAARRLRHSIAILSGFHFRPRICRRLALNSRKPSRWRPLLQIVDAEFGWDVFTFCTMSAPALVLSWPPLLPSRWLAASVPVHENVCAVSLLLKALPSWRF